MVPLFVVLVIAFATVIGAPPSTKLKGPYIGGRIIGGKDADIADYPYQLCLIYEDFGPFCGATLITPEWALTAAHCTTGSQASNITIRAGSSVSTSGGQLVNVEKIYEHEGFVYETAANDIALLKLSSNITVGNSKPIALSTSKPKANQTAIVTGWGIMDEDDDDSIPDVLQVVEVPIVSQEDCKKAYEDDDFIDTMLCAGLLDEGGKDACSGDSGGPLVVVGVVAGIVSWGDGCAEADKPGVYTDVSSYQDWIQETMSSDS